MKTAEHDTCRAAGTVPEDPCASIPRDSGDRALGDDDSRRVRDQPTRTPHTLHRNNARFDRLTTNRITSR
ncbi:hypothetical protein CJ179_37690 [Rhodococcus sp. ACS1]|nr:hypothetical protein CJ179_37690 [Rhodococcus sp. ACS1]